MGWARGRVGAIHVLVRGLGVEIGSDEDGAMVEMVQRELALAAVNGVKMKMQPCWKGKGKGKGTWPSHASQFISHVLVRGSGIPIARFQALSLLLRGDGNKMSYPCCNVGFFAKL